MHEGITPEDWLDCAMAVLPMPLKNYAVLKGYRIMTMANISIKLLEKLAAYRLVRDLEGRGCLPNGLGGARLGRSMPVNVEMIVHRLQEQMHTGPMEE